MFVPQPSHESVPTRRRDRLLCTFNRCPSLHFWFPVYVGIKTFCLRVVVVVAGADAGVVMTCGFAVLTSTATRVGIAAILVRIRARLLSYLAFSRSGLCRWVYVHIVSNRASSSRATAFSYSRVTEWRRTRQFALVVLYAASNAGKAQVAGVVASARPWVSEARDREGSRKFWERDERGTRG